MLELIRAERGLAYVEKAFRDYLLCGIWGAGLVKYGCPHGLSVTAHVRQRPLVR